MIAAASGDVKTSHEKSVQQAQRVIVLAEFIVAALGVKGWYAEKQFARCMIRVVVRFVVNRYSSTVSYPEGRFTEPTYLKNCR